MENPKQVIILLNAMSGETIINHQNSVVKLSDEAKTARAVIFVVPMMLMTTVRLNLGLNY